MPSETAVVAAPPISAPITFTARDEFELALRQAKVYAASTIVPEQYQDNLPNCLIALNMAKRIGMDPLQCMQSLYIVHGRPGWSGQFLIASFNQCGRFSAMRFEWKGQAGEKEWGCRAYAIEKATGDKILGPWVTWKMVEAEGWASKNGSKWKTLPELMFTYRAAAFLVRTHAPEIAMGLQTVEEIGDVIDVTPSASDERESPVDRAKDRVREALQAQEPKSNGAPDVTEESVSASLGKASNADALDAAATLIDALPDAEAKQRALAIYHERRAALAALAAQ